MLNESRAYVSLLEGLDFPALNDYEQMLMVRWLETSNLTKNGANIMSGAIRSTMSLHQKDPVYIETAFAGWIVRTKRSLYFCHVGEQVDRLLKSKSTVSEDAEHKHKHRTRSKRKVRLHICVLCSRCSIICCNTI